jgi:hypothetical protein
MRCPEKVSTCQQASGPVLRQSLVFYPFVYEKFFRILFERKELHLFHVSIDFPKMFRAPLCGHGTQRFTISGHEHRDLARSEGKMKQGSVDFHL